VSESFLKDRVVLHCGDCRDVLAGHEENSFDSCVTDPPYHLTSIVRRFGNECGLRDTKTSLRASGIDPHSRTSRGFMGRTWDGGDIAFRPELWAQVYRVLKPGAHLLAFGGTRTYHRMACAIEDAGFEIRDTVLYLYGSGFPKSHDVSKGIDRAAGAEREVVGTKFGQPGYSLADNGRTNKVYSDLHDPAAECAISAPATPAARQWEGWGTALKPACELIVLARKPLSESTVASNVLKWGTGAINVDGCRVGGGDDKGIWPITKRRHTDQTNGRWPANVIHDGSEEVAGAFPDRDSGGQVRGNEQSDSTANVYGKYGVRASNQSYDDFGSAARFFYAVRPDEPSADRRYTDKGSTNFAALPGARRDAVPPSRLFYTSKADGDDRLGSKREAEYQDDIRRRMKLVLSGPDERARESIKAKNLPYDPGPLFGGLEIADTGKPAVIFGVSAGYEKKGDNYNADKDFSESINECYRDIRERVANGGPGWGGWPE